MLIANEIELAGLCPLDFLVNRFIKGYPNVIRDRRSLRDLPHDDPIPTLKGSLINKELSFLL